LGIASSVYSNEPAGESAHGNSTQRLVLNDVGRCLTAGVRAPRGSLYVGKCRAASDDRGGRAVRWLDQRVHSARTPTPKWRFPHRARRAKESGRSLRMHYDPAIAIPSTPSCRKDVELWSFYDAIRARRFSCAASVGPFEARHRGGDASRGPRAKVVEIKGVGHAPTLLHDIRSDRAGFLLDRR